MTICGAQWLRGPFLGGLVGWGSWVLPGHPEGLRLQVHMDYVSVRRSTCECAESVCTSGRSVRMCLMHLAVCLRMSNM